MTEEEYRELHANLAEYYRGRRSIWTNKESNLYGRLADEIPGLYDFPIRLSDRKRSYAEEQVLESMKDRYKKTEPKAGHWWDRPQYASQNVQEAVRSGVGLWTQLAKNTYFGEYKLPTKEDVTHVFDAINDYVNSVNPQLQVWRDMGFTQEQAVQIQNKVNHIVEDSIKLHEGEREATKTK